MNVQGEPQWLMQAFVPLADQQTSPIPMFYLSVISQCPQKAPFLNPPVNTATHPPILHPASNPQPVDASSDPASSSPRTLTTTSRSGWRRLNAVPTGGE